MKSTLAGLEGMQGDTTFLAKFNEKDENPEVKHGF